MAAIVVAVLGPFVAMVALDARHSDPPAHANGSHLTKLL
jgi:hypothetical protein